MTSVRRFLLPLLLLLVACQAISVASQTPSYVLTELTTPDTPSPSPFQYSTITPTFTPSLTPFVNQTSAPVRLAPTYPPNTNYHVQFHPDGDLYVGDLVSLEVIAPPNIDLDRQHLQMRYSSLQVEEPIEADFGSFGIGGRSQATLQWFWDTTGLSVGEHSLFLSVQPDGPSWIETVFLNPRGQVPPPEPHARWSLAESECCLVYYIKGTPAERDLSNLLDVLDNQAEKASKKIEANLVESVAITFLPRVLGHGGFTDQGVSISYLDRNYAGGDLETVLHHEITHILDNRLGGELRPTFLMEGLAVYLSGGHYKPEPLIPRAAALLPPAPDCVQWNPPEEEVVSHYKEKGCGLDQFIQFDKLTDNFYLEQHEIGYLEAGALVEYMVKTWGWKAFSTFYRDIHPQPEPSEDYQEKLGAQYRATNAALTSHFGITLDQLEEEFRKTLMGAEFTPEISQDVKLTIEFYESVRFYQANFDPSAYFLTAWMPDGELMRKRGIVADYLRRPTLLENLTLENMLAEANLLLLVGQYQEASQIINATNIVFEYYPDKGIQAFSVHPLANDYLTLVEASLENGYTPERIQIEGDIAQVQATSPDQASIPLSSLSELVFIRDEDGWRLEGFIEAQSR